jgi:beta-alanine--pyruvate transaminase
MTVSGRSGAGSTGENAHDQYCQALRRGTRRRDANAISAEGLDAHWMAYSGNRQFKKDPRIIVGADGIYYIDDKGRRIMDGLSGLWTCGLGHNRPEIADAVSQQLRTLDYSPASSLPAKVLPARRTCAQPDARGPRLRVLHRFRFRIGRHVPEDGARLLAPERAAEQDQADRPHQGLPRRQLRRHISVGGIVANRKMFGQGVEADICRTR